MDISSFGPALTLLITAIILPFVTGYLSRSTWRDWIKFVLCGVFAAVVGTAELYVAGSFEGLSLQDWGGYIGMVYGSSAIVFWLVVNNIPSLRDWLANHGLKPKA
jgi:hypothetical protein